MVSPCWFLEGGPQHDVGGGILGNGTVSKGNVRGDESISAGTNIGGNGGVRWNGCDFLLLQQLLTVFGVTGKGGADGVGVDGVGVDGDDKDLQQLLFGARGRNDSIFFFFLGTNF
jgi:hypothetical protein